MGPCIGNSGSGRVYGLALLVALCGFGPGGEASAQEPKRDPQLATDLQDYDRVLRARDNRGGERDAVAIALLGKLMARFEKYGDKDQRSVVKALEGTFRLARRTPAASRLYENAVASLSLTGKLGAAPLRRLFHAPQIAKGPGKVRKSWFGLRAQILRALGKCQDGRTADFLLEVALRNAETDQFLAAAGQALGDFEKRPEPLRKEIAHQLIRELNRVHGLANARVGRPDPHDLQSPTFRRRLQAIRGAWNKTLQRLTRQSLNQPQEWQRFWNKHKDKPWQPGSYQPKDAGGKRRRG